MKISENTYRGFNYTILFADQGDWGKHLNHFYTTCEHNFDGDFNKDIDIVHHNIRKEIDSFLNKTPETVDNLIEELANLLVWTGYEEAHLDEKASKLLITAYIKKHYDKS